MISNSYLGENIFGSLPIWDSLNAPLNRPRFFKIVGLDHPYKISVAAGIVYELAGDVTGIGLVSSATAARSRWILGSSLLIKLTRSCYFEAWNKLLMIMVCWVLVYVMLLMSLC